MISRNLTHGKGMMPKLILATEFYWTPYVQQSLFIHYCQRDVGYLSANVLSWILPKNSIGVRYQQISSMESIYWIILQWISQFMQWLLWVGMVQDFENTVLNALQDIHSESQQNKFLIKPWLEFQSIHIGWINREPVPSLDVYLGKNLEWRMVPCLPGWQQSRGC